jgi:formylglycine-generating enzyme required for sulfatase activity
MGSENGADDERPVHQVSVDSFSIAIHPVTNQEYRKFLQANPQETTPEFLQDSRFSSDLQPVVGVSWFDVNAYSIWLSRNSGKRYRIPTEAEWEFAACAGSVENIYPWGKRNWEERVELHDRFQTGPESVGSFEPNAFGVFDMGMNVHEWCSDWYGKDYYGESVLNNPRGPEHGMRRSSRGGSWRHAVKISRCAARSSIPPHMRYADYGFRLVLIA